MDNSNNNCMVYIGTDSTGKSEGIYGFSFNTSTGQLDPKGVLAKLRNPTYLAVSKNKKFLYSIKEMEISNDESNGAIAAYSIDSKTGNLNLLNYKLTESKVNCHLNTDSENKYLFTANYKEGIVTTFSIESDGSIGNLLSAIKHQGSGSVPDRQKQPHAHFVTLTPDEKYLCAVDLGIDKIVTYGLNHEKGTLTPLDKLSVSINAGSGPRHMDFHPNGKFAYLVNELSSDIVVLEYSNSSTLFNQLQYISTLPEGYTKDSACSAIHVSPDGNFLYASNRGHDSLAIFSIDKFTGKLTFITHSSTFGKIPRDFDIDPTGKYIIAANKDSDSIVTFSIESSGSLIKVNNIFTVPNPICVKFACL